MGKVKELLKVIIKKDSRLYLWQEQTRLIFRSLVLGDKKITEEKFKRIFKRELDLKNPKTLNEKIQWLKLYSNKDFHTILADKLAVREWLSSRFGTEYLVPLIFHTSRYQEINPDNIPDEPCIVKANNGCGAYRIIRDKNDVNWKLLRKQCKNWLKTNYYYASQEWQYKNIKPCIIVEKLLETKDGKIPNDYKLHFMNGNFEFVYCSIDREGGNYRNIYDANWESLAFDWIAPTKIRANIKGPEISAPKEFLRMIEIGKEIAKLFPYVRVDFYDVDGILYYGEVTLHHGSGFDVFIPESYDYEYGKKVTLPMELLKKVK